MSKLVEQSKQYMDIGTVLEEELLIESDMQKLDKFEKLYKEKSSYKKIALKLPDSQKNILAAILLQMRDVLRVMPDARIADGVPNFKITNKDLNEPMTKYKRLHDDLKRLMKGGIPLNVYRLDPLKDDANKIIKNALGSGSMSDMNLIFKPFKSKYKAGFKFLAKKSKGTSKPKTPAQKKTKSKSPSNPSKSTTAGKVHDELQSALDKLFALQMNMYNYSNQLSSDGVDPKDVTKIMKGLNTGFGQLETVMGILDKLK